MDTSIESKIVSFLNSIPRNRLIILETAHGTDFLFTDIGYELAKVLETSINHKQISMLTTDLLEGIIQESKKYIP